MKKLVLIMLLGLCAVQPNPDYRHPRLPIHPPAAQALKQKKERAEKPVPTKPTRAKKPRSGRI